MKKYWKTFVWAAVIFYLSSIPGSDVSKIKFLNIPHMDKLAHFGMYFIFSFLFVFETNNNSIIQNTNTLKILFTLLVCISYGMVMEFFQNVWFEERSAEFADIIANSLGSVAAIPFFYIMKITVNQRNK